MHKLQHSYYYYYYVITYRYLEHRGTHKGNTKKDAILKERFNLIDSAFELFGFSRRVSIY